MLKRQEAAPYIQKETFAALYEAHHRAVFRYVYGLLGGQHHEAEDISAETFMKAWDARGRFMGNEEQALSWLFTIAKRCVIDRWRKEHYRIFDIEDFSILDEKSPEDDLGSEEEQAILIKLLGKLDAEKREILVLRYLLAWSVNRIAEYLDKTPNAVSQSIRRSLQDLREAWPEQE